MLIRVSKLIIMFPSYVSNLTITMTYVGEILTDGRIIITCSMSALLNLRVVQLYQLYQRVTLKKVLNHFVYYRMRPSLWICRDQNPFPENRKI